MKIYEQPSCRFCEEKAISLFSGEFLCGRCIEKAVRKLEEKKRKALLEVMG